MTKQSPDKAPQKSRRALKQHKGSYPQLVEFPQARGRTVSKLELNLDSDFNCIAIRFTDNTDLAFVIDSALTFRADYSRWKKGNQKMLKRWPVFRSPGMGQ